MYLCDREIQALIDQGIFELRSTNPDFPFRDLQHKKSYEEESQIQPASIDLRVGNVFLKFKKDVKIIDVSEFVSAPGLSKLPSKDMNSLIDRFIVSPTQPIEIPPLSWIGGQTLEYLRMPDGIAGKIEGRSRIARMGLSIHCTGDFINPLFEGVMPLQIINHNIFPVRIYAYMSICQLMLVKLEGYPDQKYPSLNPPYIGETEAGTTVFGRDEALVQRALEREDEEN